MSTTTYNPLTTVRLSKSEYVLRVFEDEEKTTPLNLFDIPLLFIGKVKITDPDDDAVFTLTIGDGLELDEDAPELNEVVVTLLPSHTEDLSATKPTTLYCELMATAPVRKTLGKVTIPVVPSVKHN